MLLIARKPCRFNGRDFFMGDSVPAELVADPAAQVRLGVLTITKSDDDIPAGKEPAEPHVGEIRIDIPLLSSSGDVVISISCDTASETLRLLQLTADDAVSEIERSENQDLLTVMKSCDKRRAVRIAASARLEELVGCVAAPDEEPKDPGDT